jgi:hypothetical protein
LILIEDVVRIDDVIESHIGSGDIGTNDGEGQAA